MFLGACRYNDFQRALPRISPTVLSKRLKQMEADGLIIKKVAPGEKSGEYRLTRCGREVGPVVDHLANWGLRWARRKLSEEDLEVGSLVWDLHRTIVRDELPDGETVLCFNVSDQTSNKTWWIVVGDKVVDCDTDDTGKDVDLFVTGTLASVAEVWMGDRNISDALKSDSIVLTGSSHLARTAPHWFPRSIYAEVRPERLRS